MIINGEENEKCHEEVSAGDDCRAQLLEALKSEQRRAGYLSMEFLVKMAHSLDLPVGEVYGVATFYSFLSTKPQGKNIIRVCKSLPCFFKGSDIVIESVRRELGIKPGETTADGAFSFELTNCIGACDSAPAMMINSGVYGDLTQKRIARILREYR